MEYAPIKTQDCEKYRENKERRRDEEIARLQHEFAANTDVLRAFVDQHNLRNMDPSGALRSPRSCTHWHPLWQGLFCSQGRVICTSVALRSASWEEAIGRVRVLCLPRWMGGHSCSWLQRPAWLTERHRARVYFARGGTSTVLRLHQNSLGVDMPHLRSSTRT